MRTLIAPPAKNALTLAAQTTTARGPHPDLNARPIEVLSEGWSALSAAFHFVEVTDLARRRRSTSGHADVTRAADRMALQRAERVADDFYYDITDLGHFGSPHRPRARHPTDLDGAC